MRSLLQMVKYLRCKLTVSNADTDILNLQDDLSDEISATNGEVSALQTAVSNNDTDILNLQDDLSDEISATNGEVCRRCKLLINNDTDAA